MPLLPFNGIGGNIELLGPVAHLDARARGHHLRHPRRRPLPPPALPYRMKGIARLAAGALDHYGHAQADVLGISWGGGGAAVRAQPGRAAAG
ncbi:MAG: hypothetical protein U1F67_20800 [Rubrivivax sp.]